MVCVVVVVCEQIIYISHSILTYDVRGLFNQMVLLDLRLCEGGGFFRRDIRLER